MREPAARGTLRLARRRPDPDDEDDADGAGDGSPAPGDGPTDIGGERDPRVQFPFGTSADDRDLDGSAAERPAAPKRPPPGERSPKRPPPRPR